MQIMVSGIPIELCKKKIKNMHLYVKPPTGKVSVSAPLDMSDEAIERFVRTKVSWIKKQIIKFELQPRQSVREYVSGETLYVWGKQYFLQVEYGTGRNLLMLSGDKAVLTARKDSTAEQRDNFVKE
jgi:predicted metal-dependent hydrolase